MGCSHSHLLQTDENEADVEMADGFSDPAPPTPTDSRLPLSALQVFKLKKSWKGIKRCMEATGIEMFVSKGKRAFCGCGWKMFGECRMFRGNENVQNLFSSLRDLKTSDELRMSEVLEKHASKVMGILDDSICNIDSVDDTLDLLSRIGAQHNGYSGFSSELFWEIEKPFLESVKLTLGDRYTDNMDTIYKITIKFILENLIKGMKGS